MVYTPNFGTIKWVTIANKGMCQAGAKLTLKNFLKLNITNYQLHHHLGKILGKALYSNIKGLCPLATPTPMCTYKQTNRTTSPVRASPIRNINSLHKR